MNGPLPKKTPRLSPEAARKVDDDDRQHIAHSQRPDKSDIRRMRREYRLLCVAQAPVERVFWQLEQCKAQLADQLANEGVAPFCKPRRGVHSTFDEDTNELGGGSKPASTANGFDCAKYKQQPREPSQQSGKESSDGSELGF
jgi:hypothetical protein